MYMWQNLLYTSALLGLDVLSIGCLHTACLGMLTEHQKDRA